MADSKLDVTKITMRHFELIGFNIHNAGSELLDKDEVGGFRFVNTTNSAFNLEKNLAKVDLEIEIFTLDDESEEDNGAGGKFKFEILFEIENLVELAVEAEDETIEVEPLLDMTLTGLSYSTARGVILTRSLGTILEGVVLPIVNPANMGK